MPHPCPSIGVSAAMQELKLADDLFGQLGSRPGEAKSKTATIRDGHRSLVRGPLRFIGARDKSLSRIVQVTAVRHTRLDALSVQDAADYGVPSAAELAQVVRQYYPDAEADCKVTLVLFET